mmetsp:Transcript_21252/g.50517  ORF Transcript_21252/g.50517 Transcript_21252/m.50517 type:complete len:566 (-) Transcript_21252:125-1822(-)
MSKVDGESGFPEFIHFATGGRSDRSKKVVDGSKDDSAAPPLSSVPAPRSTFQTPTKTASTQPRRGILKNSSYRFTGRSCSSSGAKAKQIVVSTPTTVGTQDCGCSLLDYSVEEDDEVVSGSSVLGSAGGSISTKGMRTAVDKLICDMAGIDQNATKKKKCSGQTESDIDGNRLSKQNHVRKSKASEPSSSSVSVASTSTSSTSICSTEETASTTSTTKEEQQRCARIKHIENLNERINNAKARRLVERKAFRREDKLLLRLARQLKSISKQIREDAMKIHMLEESNRLREKAYNHSLDDLNKLRSDRIVLIERLRVRMEEALADDREQLARVLRVQKAELEAHKRNHQFHCQALCESVLEADNDLERMRDLWEEHLGEGRVTRRSPLLRGAMVVMVLVLAVFIIFAGGVETNGAANLNLSAEEPMVRAEIPSGGAPKPVPVSEEDHNTTGDDVCRSTNSTIPTDTATATTASMLESTTETSDENDELVKPVRIQSEPTSRTIELGTNDLFLRDVARNNLSFRNNTNEYVNTAISEKKQKRRKGHRFKPIHVVANLFRKPRNRDDL